MRNVWLLCGLLAACCGCGGSDLDVELGKVSGVVTLDGKPLPNAEVLFLPAQGSSSSGITDENGEYDLRYGGGHLGGVVGQHQVRIRAVKVAAADTSAEEPDPLKSGDAHSRGGPPKKGPELKSPIPAKYATADSGLSFTVEAGENTANFDLKSS